MSISHRRHPKGPRATLKYQSYLRRYKRSGIGVKPVYKYDLWVGNLMVCNSSDCDIGTHSYNWLRNKNASAAVETNTQTLCSITGKRKNIDGLIFEKITNGNCGGGFIENSWNYATSGSYTGLFSGAAIAKVGEFQGDADYKNNPFFSIEEKWIVGNYEVYPGYSCNCPDFTQNTEGSAPFSDVFKVSRWISILRGRRSWAGSGAGPFNPCKHIMAVKRHLHIAQNYTGYP